MSVISKYCKTVLLVCSFFFAPVSLAATDEHEGIEITVNINTANAEQLETLLNGIGPDKAENIIQYRTEFGKFASVDDLAKVKGIGQSTVEKNRQRIKL